MEINIKRPQTINVKTVKVCAKVCDSACYTFISDKGEVVKDLDCVYVPSFFPGDHYGDYLQLDIDIDTGQIKNWKNVDPVELGRFLSNDEDEDE